MSACFVVLLGRQWLLMQPLLLELVSSFELQLGSVLVRVCSHCLKLYHSARTVRLGNEMCPTISRGSYNRLWGCYSA